MGNSHEIKIQHAIIWSTILKAKPFLRDLLFSISPCDDGGRGERLSLALDLCCGTGRNFFFLCSFHFSDPHRVIIAGEKEKATSTLLQSSSKWAFLTQITLKKIVEIGGNDRLNWVARDTQKLCNGNGYYRYKTTTRWRGREVKDEAVSQRSCDSCCFLAMGLKKQSSINHDDTHAVNSS